MTEVRLHRLALREYRRARSWYAKRSLRAESRFIETVAQAIIKIEDQVTLAPADEDNIRWVKTRRYPYLLYYEYFPDNVALVLAIAHKRKRLDETQGEEVRQLLTPKCSTG